LNAHTTCPAGEATMCACDHEIVERQQRSQGFHVLSWGCRWCASPASVEYHHESWCHPDFCGPGQSTGLEPRPRPSPEQVGVKVERFSDPAL
jgi:hypothetical protein